jgi:hypothetical protein
MLLGLKGFRVYMILGLKDFRVKGFQGQRILRLKQGTLKKHHRFKTKKTLRGAHLAQAT